MASSDDDHVSFIIFHLGMLNDIRFIRYRTSDSISVFDRTFNIW